MTLSANRAAYADCFLLLDKALAAKRGVQKVCSTREEAFRLRNRINRARIIDRDQNKQIYAAEPDHPLYNKSEYYALTIRIEEDTGRDVWLVLLQKNLIRDVEVEEIPDFEGENINIEELVPAPPEKVVEDEFGLDPGGTVEPSETGSRRHRRF